MVEGDTFKITIATNNIDIVQSSLSNYTDQDGLRSMTSFIGSQLDGEAMTEGITVGPDANTRRLQ